MKVGIMGFGEIGSNNKWYLEKLKNIEIAGYDPRYHPICDVYIICTDSDHVIEACEQIKTIDEKPILLIESTIKVGTCRTIFESFNGMARIIYCPQRFWAKDPEQRGVRRFRLISAFCNSDMGLGVNIYKNMFNIPVYPVYPIEIAEFAKVAENAYRGVQIAFAQELKIEADKLKLDFNELREAIMTASPMHYLPKALDGIGGHCIPMAMDWTKDFSDVVFAAVEANDIYVNYIKKD
jgi:UDP-N-acetyl-D-mannosaminuronic acid dehydrogenase